MKEIAEYHTVQKKRPTGLLLTAKFFGFKAASAFRLGCFVPLTAALQVRDRPLDCCVGTMDVNRHTRESQIQRSFRTHFGTERQLGGAAAGPARSSRRKSTLLAVPSLLDEKEFLQQMRAGPLDRRFPLFVGLRCMLFHTFETALVSSIWRLPIFGDDFGLLFGGKNASRILKLLVREIELSEHVETAPRLR